MASDKTTSSSRTREKTSLNEESRILTVCPSERAGLNHNNTTTTTTITTTTTKPQNAQPHRSSSLNEEAAYSGGVPIARIRTTGSLLNLSSLANMSFDQSSLEEEISSRSPVLPERDSGLRRIRQYPPRREVPSPKPTASSGNQRTTSLNLALPPPRHSNSFPQVAPSSSVPSGPTSPFLNFSEDLSRFPTESLHSFSFAHQSEDLLHNRQSVLKRSIEFMRDKLGWAAANPSIVNAHAKVSGDQEVQDMVELLQRAKLLDPNGNVNVPGLGISGAPLSGPPDTSVENLFEKSFAPTVAPISASPEMMTNDADLVVSQADEEALETVTPLSGELAPVTAAAAAAATSPSTPQLSLSTSPPDELTSKLSPPPTRRAMLKRTYTDVDGMTMQNRLTEALAQPYRAAEVSHRENIISPKTVPTISPVNPPGKAGSTVVGASSHTHGHGRQAAAAQAIFTTEAHAPWTITAANDLACLIFGVAMAEVRKMGIMEVISPERRRWLDSKLRRTDSEPPSRSKSPQKRESPTSSTSSSASSSVRAGVTAKLLSKPAARHTVQSRKSKSVNAMGIDDSAAAKHLDLLPANKSRGVLLCGDVVPIQKRNGETGAASLWVKEKQGGLIWVMEEIAQDVAYLTVDEIGCVDRSEGALDAIWGLERIRRGTDIRKIIPELPKLAGTHTGALDFDQIADVRRYTARTANSISIPITVDIMSGKPTFRVSSFPHIAGIVVLSSENLKIKSANSVFSAALFGQEQPDGLPVTDLIPSFDKILHLLTDEDKIRLEDGLVIPEHSFRRARALLALRDGRADAASMFLRPSGLPAKHRDGADIMVDVQMRVVKSDRHGPIEENVIVEESSASGDEADSQPASEVVYALWITYSRQLHAVNHGVGHVNPMISRPGTPPQQPAPVHPSRVTGGSESDESSSGPPETRNTTPSSSGHPSSSSLLTQQIQEASSGTESSSEPYEHPSPDMVTAGCVTVPKKQIADFIILEEMGQGAYGQVKLARYKKADAHKMVIKYVTKRRILVDTWTRDRKLGTVPLEIHVLDFLRRHHKHPNIVEMADFFEDDINYYIEMIPHGLPGMDLFDYIELRVNMEEKECRKIFVQVANALDHLHNNALVVHRDIKDENVILDGDGAVKLVDFGSAAYIKSGPFDVFVGTIDYAAPEVLRGSPYRGKEQDVWALGILLYTIVYKENPFYSIDEIMDHDLRVPYVMSEDCIDLIRKMLDRDVDRRIGIQSVLEHPWCTHVDEEDD